MYSPHLVRMENIPERNPLTTSKFSFFANTMLKRTLFYLLLGSPVLSSGQTGGSHVYSFLDIPASARIASMGGSFISVKDNDLSLAFQTPSLLNKTMDKSLALSGVSYIDGLKLGDAVYARDMGESGTFMAGIHYANYGKFKETNVYGEIEGTFKAADYELLIGWSRPLNRSFSLGASLKALYSDYYIYNSFGMAVDLSATFHDTINQWTVSLLARNAGLQIKNYTEGNNEPLPAEVLIGVSKRLTHTPLRFSLTYRHLEKFDLRYDDPYNLGDVDPVSGESSVKEISFLDNLTRHFIIGTELLLSKNFHIRLAYNFQRRKELLLENRPATTGFSFGAGLKVSKFIISYGRANYHVGAAANHISISTNLSEFNRKLPSNEVR